MPGDIEQLHTIRSQTLALLAEITAKPKPTYRIDGQSVSWAEYLVRLRTTVDWCERKLAAAQPCEIRSQASTS